MPLVIPNYTILCPLFLHLYIYVFAQTPICRSCLEWPLVVSKFLGSKSPAAPADPHTSLRRHLLITHARPWLSRSWSGKFLLQGSKVFICKNLEKRGHFFWFGRLIVAFVKPMYISMHRFSFWNWTRTS